MPSVFLGHLHRLFKKFPRAGCCRPAETAFEVGKLRGKPELQCARIDLHQPRIAVPPSFGFLMLLMVGATPFLPQGRDVSELLARHGFGGLLDLGIFGIGSHIGPECEGSLLVADRHGQRAVGSRQPRGPDFPCRLGVEGFGSLPAHQRRVRRLAAARL